MNINKKVDNFLNPLELHYKYDDILKFNNYYSNTNLGYKSFFNNVFENVRDHSINNYNIFYLTDNKKLTDFVNIQNDLYNDKHLITYLQINDKYLVLNGLNLGLSDEPITKFEISFLSDGTCYIKSFVNDVIVNEGDKFGHNVCLICNSEGDIKVINYDTNNNINGLYFNYILNDNKLNLFIKYGENASGYVTLVNNELKIVKQTDYFNENQTFIIENKKNDDVDINTSYGIYENRSLDIDSYKSIYNLSNNLLLTSEYSYSDGDNIYVDILNLKNQLTNRGYSSNTELVHDNNFREYTSLFTGTKQETGNSLLTLNYSYYLTDLQIKPGLNTFTTPLSFNPYDKIDINHMSFTKSGSFGFVNPSLADKIYKINDNNLIKSYAWLSCSDLNDEGIWLSRYYNPMLTNVQNISSSPAKIIHNVTDIDKIFYENNEIVRDGYVDVISDLTFEPNTTYIYKRITNKEINTYSNNNKNLVLSSIKLVNTKKDIIYDNDTLNETYTFTGDRYATLPIKNYVYNNQLSLSFYLNSENYDNVIADQILGNLNCYGFSFKKNTVITPLPIISFTGGLTFGVENDIWDKISAYTQAGGGWLDHDIWSTYLYTWNRFLSDSDTDVRGQYVFNTDLKLIDLLPVSDAYIRTVRTEHTDFYYTVYSKQILKMTPVGVEVISFSFSNDENENITHVNYDDKFIYCISDKYNIYELSYNNSQIRRISVGGYDFNTVFKHNNNYFVANNLSGIGEYDPRFGIFYDNIYKGDSGFDSIYKNKHCIFYFNPNTTTETINKLNENNTSVFFSADSIQDFKIIDNYIGIIYNNSKINIYNTDRDLLYSYDFSNIKKRPISFDYVGEITPDGYKNYFIILTADKVYDEYGREILLKESEDPKVKTLQTNPYDYVSLYKLENFELTLINKLSNLSHNLQSNETRLTNYSLIKRIHENYNDYYIKYKLINKYNNIIDTRVINLPKFDNGENYFVINFDGINGKLEIYNNGKLIITDTFEVGKFLSENVFDENFLIGTDSYFNTPLFNYIQQDNYFVKNLQIKYFKLYKNVLLPEEIKILNLQYYKVDDIILNIPCGFRNKQETINRFFKQSVPGFKTNKFDIIIKNMNVNEKDKEKLSNVLRKLLSDKLPAQTDLNNIKYIFTI